MKKKTNKFKELLKKSPKIFRKEGFYVALFVCLCIVTIAGTILIKKSNTAQDSKINTQEENEITLNIDNNDKVNSVMENSERVKNDEKDNNKKGNESADNKSASKAVTSKNELNFINPVDGKIIKEHNSPLTVEEGSKYEFFGGVSVAAKVGTPVKAAEVGVVDDVNLNDVTYGVTIIIKHPNGLKTVYSNLDKNVKVKKGDQVSKGQELGKVGKTSKTLAMILKEDFIQVKVLSKKDDKYCEVDPMKYFTFKK